MALSEELLVDWYWYSYDSTGVILPVNSISITDEGNLRMGYEVPVAAEPILMRSGLRVRTIVIEYETTEVEEEWLH